MRVVGMCQGWNKAKVTLLCLAVTFTSAVIWLHLNNHVNLQIIVKAAKHVMPFSFSRSSDCETDSDTCHILEISQEEKIKKLTDLLVDRLGLISGGDVRNVSDICVDNMAAPCLPATPCSRPLESRSPEERVRELTTSHWSQPSRDDLARVLALTDHIPLNDIIIASACSEDHFDELQAMFKNLHETVFPTLKNFTIILFDIGLTKEQREVTEATCNCTVVTFPFEKFPDHVKDLHCYGWKPIVMRATLSRARHLLVYQDSSIRWNSSFYTTWDRALRYGQQTVLGTGPSFPGNTLKQMFDYMQEEVCPFRKFQELQGGIQMARNDLLTIEAVYNPWLKCALDRLCVCPQKPSPVAQCRTKQLHRCHRFDQSAFNLIMAKLYGVDRDQMTVPPDDHSLTIARIDTDLRYLYVLKYGESWNKTTSSTEKTVAT